MGGVTVDKEDGTLVHPLADARDALRWLANQNCITLHAWQSRHHRLHSPDRFVFDLDPSDADFAVVRATARTVAEYWTTSAWCPTSRPPARAGFTS